MYVYACIHCTHVHHSMLLMCCTQFSQQREEQPLPDNDYDDELQTDGADERCHYRENCKSPGRIIFSVSVNLCMHVSYIHYESNYLGCNFFIS